MNTTRRKPIVLTAEWLDQQDACEDQAALAILYFGERATMTRTMLHECAALGLDLDWLAERILTPKQRAAYQQATATAWAAYQQATAPALAAHEQATNTARATFQQATAAAWATYQQATAPALAAALGLP